MTDHKSSGAGRLRRRRGDSTAWPRPCGSRAATGSPSSAIAASAKNTARGPAASASTAPARRPSIGPAEMIARAVPLRRAARAGQPWPAPASRC